MEEIIKGSYLVTDGAKAYPLCQRPPAEVNHAAAGEFVRSKRRGPKPALSVHTGGIGCTWKKIKDKLPLGKINKDQQNTAGTACCERLPRN